MNIRVLIAGFQHETNTFAPSRATYENFEKGEGFPMMARGEQVLALRDVNIPAGGFIQAAERAGYELLPVIWAGASPSAHVEEEAYERIVKEITDAAREWDFDAIYLDLHGAMVAEHTDDGEGTLLERLRVIVGPQLPIVVSLDLHTNFTQKMFENADALVAYRTYPHIDLAQTGERAAQLLERLLIQVTPYARVMKRAPFLIPINGMCTLLEPARSFYARLAELETGAVQSLSFTPGFPAADFPECGPVIWGHGSDAEAVARAVDELYATLLAEEAKWRVPLLDPDAAVLQAMRLSAGASRPVVIADTQDNPGAGGDANTTGMLRALIRNGAQRAAIGLICDPEAARAAHAAGVGAFIEIGLAGCAKITGDEPLFGRYQVMFLSDGRCRFDGPMMHGMLAELGLVACLKIDDVLVAVSSNKAQMFDRNLYRVAGIEPEAMKILVNKSSVHFRADFEPIAEAILVAQSPGPAVADPAALNWTRLAEGMRTSPMGRPFTRAVAACAPMP
ncbi:M81 family metallopeptidase [Pseudomonas sp. S2_B12]